MLDAVGEVFTPGENLVWQVVDLWRTGPTELKRVFREDPALNLDDLHAQTLGSGLKRHSRRINHVHGFGRCGSEHFAVAATLGNKRTQHPTRKHIVWRHRGPDFALKIFDNALILRIVALAQHESHRDARLGSILLDENLVEVFEARAVREFVPLAGTENQSVCPEGIDYRLAELFIERVGRTASGKRNH